MYWNHRALVQWYFMKIGETRNSRVFSICMDCHGTRVRCFPYIEPCSDSGRVFFPEIVFMYGKHNRLLPRHSCRISGAQDPCAPEILVEPFRKSFLCVLYIKISSGPLQVFFLEDVSMWATMSPSLWWGFNISGARSFGSVIHLRVSSNSRVR